jgi:LPXTG-motif cell wall-anchored protein
MDDGWEVRWALQPTNASDAEEDADGDGFSNLEEYRGGSNPRDPDSRPETGLGSNAWLFVVALVAAVLIIVLSLLMGRRRKERAAPEEPTETDDRP